MSERLNPELAAVEAALASLSPADANIDRDQLMYTAGAQASKRRARQIQGLWLASTMLLVFVSVGVTGLLVRKAEPRVVERIVFRDRETGDDSAGVVQKAGVVDASSTVDHRMRFQPIEAPSQYLRLRQLVLTSGVVGLPESWHPSDSDVLQSPPVSGNREMLKELLGS